VEKCNHVRSQKFGRTKSGEQRYRCLDCGKTFVESTRTLDGMRIGTDKAAQIIRCMMEGVGIRSTVRLCGVAKNTVLDLLLLIGQRCKMFLHDAIVNVPVKDVQADELWSFVYCKNKTRMRLSLPVSVCGDRYCFVGFERHNKLALAWHVGTRDVDHGREFIMKLSRACGCREFQITTDGWQPYKRLVPAYMSSADFAQLLKIYTNDYDTGRYSPGRIIETKLKPIAGQPDIVRICTSHVERNNLTMRLWMRRFTRLTMGFSRKLLNHEAAIGLYFAAYNFVAKHSTIKTTPAVAAGITDHPWTADELIERTACYEVSKPTAWDRFIDGLPD
jgi:transposase-like protein/IS1 family transposase